MYFRVLHVWSTVYLPRSTDDDLDHLGVLGVHLDDLDDLDGIVVVEPPRQASICININISINMMPSICSARSESLALL